MKAKTIQRTNWSFWLIASLFFLWGFVHNMDPILIPHLRKSFTLTNTQSTLVDSAVFIAYFIMALPAGYLMRYYGYKVGIIFGLLIFAIGAFLFIPAADTHSYLFFLTALFIIACGLAILETAANPYASALGPSDSSTYRLNLAQSFNGLAAVIAPVVGAKMILAKGHSEAELSTMTQQARAVAIASEAALVKTPYLILGCVLVFIALIFCFAKLPVLQKSNDGANSNIVQAFKHRHLVWAMLAQFFYVGAQVCVFSLFILYATQSSTLDQLTAANFLGVCGLAFLIGRFVSTLIMRFVKPNRLLALYACANVMLCLIAIVGQGMITMYAILGICFFMSIMFPTIFDLGIKDLGNDTEYGSSLLIMSIVGGAILPRVFGYVSDFTGDIRTGYYIPLVCFMVVFYFGWKGYRPKAKSKHDLQKGAFELTISNTPDSAAAPRPVL